MIWPAIRRLRAFLRRDRLDDELAEEVRTHLDLRRRALIEQGWPAQEADVEARRQFGNVMSIRERIYESLASRLWRDGDPLGQRLTTGDFNRRSHVVVGIVRDAPYAELRHQHEPFLFRPGRMGTIMVRTSGPAATLARSTTAAVQQLDARLVFTGALPAERIAQERTAGRRTIVAVTGIGALALLIALGGVAAIASHSVARRRREIGIRIALGARRADAVRLIVRLALAPVAIGGIAGLVIASLGSRVLVRQLYGVSPLDPVSFTGTAVFLMLAALAAAWIPARRAAGVDPVVALRSE